LADIEGSRGLGDIRCRCSVAPTTGDMPYVYLTEGT